MNKLLEDGQNWAVHHGDCIPQMMTQMPPQSVDFSVFSPPFPQVFAYSSSPSDIGNSENLNREGKIHLSYFYRAIKRVLKPGRAMVVHVQQIPRQKRTGGEGLFDFRGLNIRLAERAGLIFEYDWLIRKNPQSAAIRTRAVELQFSGLERDRSQSRGTLCDYLLKFVAPGDNEIRIDNEGEVSRNDWIDWAEGSWTDVQETDTLNTAAAKSEEDTRHICCLQVEVIRRCILLYSMPGEIVFSPFAGIGSEGHVALGGKSPKTGLSIARPRRFYGAELKDEYHEQCQINLARAEEYHKSMQTGSLFDDELITSME